MHTITEKMKRNYDEKVRPTPDWNVGDEVWLNSQHISTTRPSAKLDHRWLGPFSIKKRISTSAYRLRLPEIMSKVHSVFHVSVLKKHSPDMIEERQQAPPYPVEIEGEEEWEVEAILDKRLRNKKIEYLISWKGYGRLEDSWEPESNVTNSKLLINKFNSKYPKATEEYRRSRRM